MLLVLAVPLAGVSGCGGVRDADSDLAVTRTVGTRGRDLQLGPARVIIRDQTFDRDTEVTLRRVPYDGSGELVGDVFEISASQPFPEEALRQSLVEYEIEIEPPAWVDLNSSASTRQIKLAYRHEDQWFGFNDDWSAFVTDRKVVRGSVRDPSKQPFRIAPVRWCGDNNQCSSKQCTNASVCQ